VDREVVVQQHEEAQHSRSTFSSLSAGVLIANARGELIAANPRARDIFPSLNPAGLQLKNLLGLAGVHGGGELCAAVMEGYATSSIRLGFPDGRTIDCQSRPAEDGTVVITLFDVTRYVQEAELASRDILTGLDNRRVLNERLATLVPQLLPIPQTLAVLCIDLDRFKEVNDTLGHAVGDALLTKVAERLRSVTRTSDTVARVGGDEFVIVQAGSRQPLASEALAGRLVDLLGRTYVVAGHMVNFGASIGIAIQSDGDGDAPTLLQHADMALYRAKADGRGTFRFFEPSMDVEMQARRRLELDLRRALALKQLELAFQPQIDLASRSLIGFEALLRWKHPDQGYVSPAKFIPLAEEIGLIGSIGDWVIRTACREAVSWPDPIGISVNLSPVQFRSTKLVETVGAALAASGLSADRLELEITEGALLDNTVSVLDTLHALRALGTKISMDDFGTGYSSLSYLQKFPFDKIKIDQSFVRGADDNPDCSAIVKAVAALGASLGMKTIAEGVETADQLTRIQNAGCSAVQGYLTGRPMPAHDAAALVLSTQPSRRGS
jgi:diguanylate cyclase (GGDEF)-like protein